MREAMGGIFSIQALAIFIVLMLGLLMFSVSYTKAFRIKNELVGIVEEYEGFSVDAANKFDKIALKYNYTFSTSKIYADKCRNMGYTPYVRNAGGKEYVVCLKCSLVNAEGTKDGKQLYKGAHYKVGTFVNVDIPLIRNIFPASATFLFVTGDVDLIYSSGNNSELCLNQQVS